MSFLISSLPYLLALVVIVLVTVGLHFYKTQLLPRLELTAFYKQYKFVLDYLDEIVSAAVVSIAFAPKDLAKYQDEADAKGWDIRLVAAVHIVQHFALDHGIELDEDFIVAKIEQELASEKKYGILKVADKTPPPTQVASPDPIESPPADPQQEILAVI